MEHEYKFARFTALEISGRVYTGDEMKSKAHALGIRRLRCKPVRLTWQVEGTNEVLAGKSTMGHSVQIDVEGRALPTWFAIVNDCTFLVG